jgi:hypothetical protein
VRRLSSHHSSGNLVARVDRDGGASFKQEREHHRSGSDQGGGGEKSNLQQPVAGRLTSTSASNSSASLVVSSHVLNSPPNSNANNSSNVKPTTSGISSSGSGLGEQFETELTDCFTQQKEAYISPPLLHAELSPLIGAFWPESKEEETHYKKQFSRIYTFSCISSGMKRYHICLVVIFSFFWFCFYREIFLVSFHFLFWPFVSPLELPILFFIQLMRAWRTDLLWQNGFVGTNTAKEAKICVTVSFNTHDAFVIAIYLR